MNRPSRYIGSVVTHRAAVGSKSEHAGIFLRTDDGEEWLLRRLGGHAFKDASLEALVGQRIEGVGETTGKTLLLERWKRLPDRAQGA